MNDIITPGAPKKVCPFPTGLVMNREGTMNIVSTDQFCPNCIFVNVIDGSCNMARAVAIIISGQGPKA
jgi:hypothetical protein